MKIVKDPCPDLKDVLKSNGFFDVAGGCGVDMSRGTLDCIDDVGRWFEFCPFCGRELVKIMCTMKGELIQGWGEMHND